MTSNDTSAKMRSFLEQANRVVAADEEEINDLVSQIDVLERQLARYPAYAYALSESEGEIEDDENEEDAEDHDKK